MADNFYLEFGALSPCIEEQLKNQGLMINLELLARQNLQRDADEVFRLRFRRVLTEAETDRARWRLIKEIGKHIRPIAAAGEVEA
jgi:hypothetical protein